MTVFSLEALRARHGDSLLVHFGSPDDPKLIVVDGGPSGVYDDALRPRLQQLAAASGGTLEPVVVMVSHIDDDHIHGLLDLTEELQSDRDAGREAWLRPGTLWHNHFGALVETEEALEPLAADEAVRSLAEDGEDPGRRQAAAVVASVGQGRRLADAAATLGWTLNRGFHGLVQAPEKGGAKLELGRETIARVLAPRVDELDGLRREWREQLGKLARKEADPASVAAYLDESAYNLSSIACMLEHGDRRMLLTGDARGDHVLTALAAAGYKTPLSVDILKLPHHGSIRNVDADFFASIRARHYVISADGKNGNPESATLELIAASREDDDFTIHLTYAAGKDDLGERLQAFITAQRDAGRRFAITPRADDQLSLRIDLGDDPPTP